MSDYGENYSDQGGFSSDEDVSSGYGSDHDDILGFGANTRAESNVSNKANSELVERLGAKWLEQARQAHDKHDFDVGGNDGGISSGVLSCGSGSSLAQSREGVGVGAGATTDQVGSASSMFIFGAGRANELVHFCAKCGKEAEKARIGVEETLRVEVAKLKEQILRSEQLREQEELRTAEETNELLNSLEQVEELAKSYKEKIREYEESARIQAESDNSEGYHPEGENKVPVSGSGVEELIDKGLCPSPKFVAAVMSAHRKAGELEAARRVHTMAERAGVDCKGNPYIRSAMKAVRRGERTRIIEREVEKRVADYWLGIAGWCCGLGGCSSCHVVVSVWRCCWRALWWA